MKKKIVSVLMAFTMLISCIGIQPLQAEADAGKKAETAVKEGGTDVLDDAGKLVNNVSVEGTNSFGNMLAAEFAEKAEEIEDGNGFFISAIEMEGTEATVSLEAIEDCTLVVAIYDEAGEEMLAVGSGEVTAGEHEAVVTIETENMPEYFDLMGYLIDTDSLRPLCSVFESPNYTREMQEFLKKTTEDFDENKVVNLDDDITTNFLVCEEGTRKLSGNGGANRIVSVNEETNTYVIENADSSITALKQGDSFVYPYAEGEILAGKIAKITVSGTTATIVCEDTSMEEVFEYVRIEGESLSQEAEVNEESVGEGFTYLNESQEQTHIQYNAPNAQGEQGTAHKVEAEGSYSKTKKFGLNYEVGGTGAGKIKITGTLELGIDASIKFIITASYQFLELKLDYKGNMSIGVEGSVNIEKKIAEFKFTPVPGVNIVLAPKLKLSVSAKISFGADISGTIGFQATSEGIKNISTIPKATGKLQMEASVYVGFSLTPSIEIADDWLASVGVQAAFGAEIKGVMKKEITTGGADARHTCNECVDGDINVKLDVKFQASLLNHWKYTHSLLGKSWKIADFYYSFDYNEFALASCPHCEYKLCIQVKDVVGQPVNGARVTIDGGTYMTDSSGRVTIWKPSGSYYLEVEKDGYIRSEKCSIADKAKQIQIEMGNIGFTTGLPEASDIKNTVDALMAILSIVEIGKYKDVLETIKGIDNASNFFSTDFYNKNYKTALVVYETVLNNPKSTEAEKIDAYNRLISTIQEGALSESGKANLIKNVHELNGVAKNSQAMASGSKILNRTLAAEGESESPTTAAKNFSDLKPEAVYNFYIMKNKDSEQMFSSENLIYLKQAKADSEGNLQIEYPSNISVSNAETFVVCAEQNNIADAQITAKTAYYNGKEQFVDVTVIYNGKTLEAGKDYEIEGSFSGTEAGTYSVTVTGIGAYTGEKTVNWNIEQNKLGDVNGDGKINSEDALAVLKYDVRIAQEVFVEEAADVNKDGKVNSEDALDILKHDVKLLQIS